MDYTFFANLQEEFTLPERTRGESAVVLINIVRSERDFSHCESAASAVTEYRVATWRNMI